jgi:transposase
MYTEVIDDASTASLRTPILRTVERGATVSTDEWRAYSLLTKDGYEHGVVNHSAKEYVRGEHHTNSVESFWRNIWTATWTNSPFGRTIAR